METVIDEMEKPLTASADERRTIMNTRRSTEDGVREETFVDASDDMTVYDGRNPSKNGMSSGDDTELHQRSGSRHRDEESVNGMHGQFMMNEVEHLRMLLDQAFAEKQKAEHECEGERKSLKGEVMRLKQHMKVLAGDAGLIKEEEEDDLPLPVVMSECWHLARTALSGKKKSEETIRELHSVLHIKEQEIEDLSSRITEISSASDITASYIRSTSETWSQSLRDFLDVWRDREADTVGRMRNVEEEMEKRREENEELVKKIEKERDKHTIVKEKLGIAVMKGKALLHQRDSLRQSLADKTSELLSVTARRPELEDEVSPVSSTNAIIRGLLIQHPDVSDRIECLVRSNEVSIDRIETLASALSVEIVENGFLLEELRAKNEEIADRTILMEKTVREREREDRSKEKAVESMKSGFGVVQIAAYVASHDLALHSLFDRILEDERSAEIRDLRNGILLYEEKQSVLRERLSLAVKKGKGIFRERESMKKILEDREAEIAGLHRAVRNLEERLVEETKEKGEIVDRAVRISRERDRLVSVLTVSLGITVGDSWDTSTLIERVFVKIHEREGEDVRRSEAMESEFATVRAILFVASHELALSERVLEDETAAARKRDVEIADLRQEKASLGRTIAGLEEDGRRAVAEVVGELASCRARNGELLDKVRSMEEEGSRVRSGTSPSSTEISEVGDTTGRVAPSPSPVAPHVRSMRKASVDHLALTVNNPESAPLLDAPDRKDHAFKSLNVCGLVPKQGKEVADRIDGLWVSWNGVLMGRPRVRLGVIAYSMFLHVWVFASLL